MLKESTHETFVQIKNYFNQHKTSETEKLDRVNQKLQNSVEAAIPVVLRKVTCTIMPFNDIINILVEDDMQTIYQPT